MQPEKKIEYLRQLIKKSDQAFDDAKFLISHKKFSAAINRLYYSIFHLVSVLAYLEDFKTSKHQQLMGWFNKTLIYEKKLFPVELFGIYKASFNSRMESDYEIINPPNEDDVDELFQNVSFFLEKIKGYLNSRIES